MSGIYLLRKIKQIHPLPQVKVYAVPSLYKYIVLPHHPLKNWCKQS